MTAWKGLKRIKYNDQTLCASWKTASYHCNKFIPQSLKLLCTNINSIYPHPAKGYYLEASQVLCALAEDFLPGICDWAFRDTVLLVLAYFFTSSLHRNRPKITVSSIYPIHLMHYKTYKFCLNIKLWHPGHLQSHRSGYCWPKASRSSENAKFAGPSDRRGYFLSGSGKHPSITGPCDRLIVHCSPFLPHACAKLHLQWVCQKASGSAKNLVSAGPVVWHIKKSFRILWVLLALLLGQQLLTIWAITYMVGNVQQHNNYS